MHRQSDSDRFMLTCSSRLMLSSVAVQLTVDGIFSCCGSQCRVDVTNAVTLNEPMKCVVTFKLDYKIMNFLMTKMEGLSSKVHIM